MIKHYYGSAPRSEREKLVASLVGPAVDITSKDRLRRCKEGQGILRLVQADLWLRNPSEWKTSANRHEQGLEMLRSLDTLSSDQVQQKKIDTYSKPDNGRVTSGGKFGSVRTEHAQEHDKHESLMTDLIPNIDGKRKRKRKRGGKNKVTGQDAEDDGDDSSDKKDAARMPASQQTLAAPKSLFVKEKISDVRVDPEMIVTVPTLISSSASEANTNRNLIDSKRATYAHQTPAETNHFKRHRQSEAADMKLVRSLQGGKLMTSTMLNEVIDNLHKEKSRK